VRKGNMANTALIALDARHNTHIPPSNGGIYTVVRGRLNYQLTTTTVAAGGNYNVAIIGEYTNTTTAGSVTNLLMVNGGGVGVPGSTAGDALQTDPIVATTAGTCQLRLHAVTLTLQCLGGGSTIPDGCAYVGTLRGRGRRNVANFATWNAMATTLIGRNELRVYSAYELLNGLVQVSFPLDEKEWEGFGEYAAADTVTSGNNQLTDALAPIIIVLPASVATQTYLAVVHTEWRVMYNMDNVVLASTHTQHGNARPGYWRGVSNFAANSAGAFMAPNGGTPMQTANMNQSRVGAGPGVMRMSR